MIFVNLCSFIHPHKVSMLCLEHRLTAASNKPERRFRPRKIRIRSEYNGSTGFFHQASITAAASSGCSCSQYHFTFWFLWNKWSNCVMCCVCLTGEQLTAFPSSPGTISCYGENAFIFMSSSRRKSSCVFSSVNEIKLKLSSVQIYLNWINWTLPADSKLVLDQPCCRAVYSFHPNQEGELDFNEGDVIILTDQVDANWYKGTLGSQSGLFPISYVDVLVPLPLPWWCIKRPGSLSVVKAGLFFDNMQLFGSSFALFHREAWSRVTGKVGHKFWLHVIL